MAGSNSDTQRRTAAVPALGFRILFFALLSLAMMAIDHGRDNLDGLRRTIGVIVYPIQATVSLPSRFIDWSARSTISRADLERENNQLKVERLRTRAELQRFNALEAENARLRAMLKASGKVTDNFSMAEIMAVDPNPYLHSIEINKGIRHGVFEGQAMVDANGVVGQIKVALPFSSTAVLISDPDHALPVEVLRNGLRTIAFGTGEFNRLELPYLPNNADVVIGDLLVTSGLGGAFPAGYPVATISNINLQPGQPFAALEATPAAKLDRVREVVLISPKDESGKTEEHLAEAEDTDASRE